MGTPPDDRPPGRHAGGAAAAPPPAAPSAPAPQQRPAARPAAPVRRVAAVPASAAGTLTGRARTAPQPIATPEAAPDTAPDTVPSASSAAGRAPALDPASAYGARTASSATRTAPPAAARTAQAGPEAEWSATALAAGSATAAAWAAPAVEAAPATTAAEEARAQPVAEAAPAVEDRPPAPGPTRPRAPRRPWTLGGVHLLQVLVWELVVVAVLAVHRQPLPVLVPVAAVCLVALLLTTVRLSGRWAWQVLVARLRFRARRRRTDLPGGDPAVAADAVLGAVTRGGWVDVVRVDGVDAAVFDHAGGMAVVVEASPAATHPFDDAVPALPSLGSLLPAPEDDGGPQVTVQLLVQTVPAPGIDGPEDPAAVSYRELTGGSVPARRRSWIALQVQRPPADADEEDLRQALVNAVRRVQRQVRRAGLRGHLLSPEDARAGVLTLVGGTPGGPPPGSARETWGAWLGGDLQHVTLHLVRWPDLAEGDRTRSWADHLGGVPATTTTVSVAARRSADGELDVEGAVRVVLPADVDAGPTVAALVQEAQALGGTLRRLDGDQATGVAATLPLGGFLR